MTRTRTSDNCWRCDRCEQQRRRRRGRIGDNKEGITRKWQRRLHICDKELCVARACTFSLTLSRSVWLAYPPPSPSFSGERSDRSASTARTHDADRRQHSTTQHRTSRGWHCSCVGERAGRREQTVTVTVKVTVTVTVMVTGGLVSGPAEWMDGRMDGWMDGRVMKWMEKGGGVACQHQHWHQHHQNQQQ